MSPKMSPSSFTLVPLMPLSVYLVFLHNSLTSSFAFRLSLSDLSDDRLSLSNGQDHENRSPNPYLPILPLNVMDDLDPVAPESAEGFENSREAAESDGTADRWYSFSKGSGYYVHVPKWRFGSAFPEQGMIYGIQLLAFLQC